MPRPRQSLSLLLAGLALALLPGSAVAAPAVTSTADSGPGSLRAAIIGANSGESIAVPAGTYGISSGELLVDKNLTIAGAGPAQTVVRAVAPGFRIFHVGNGKDVAISGMTIRDATLVQPGGIAEGAGIYVEEGGVSISDVAFANNTVDATGLSGASGGIAGGGAVAARKGRLAISGSSFTGNVAISRGGAAKGGGIAEGGGVYGQESPVTISASTFNGNRVEASGGAGAANAAQGGGIATGAGAAARKGSLTIAASSFAGGATISRGGLGAEGGIAEGGGAMTQGALTTISTSTFSGGEVDASGGQGAAAPKQNGGIARGGGVALRDPAPGSNLLSSTAAGNSVRSLGGAGGVGGIASGGGFNLQAEDGPVLLSQLTLAANSATTGTEGIAEGGGLNAEIYLAGAIAILSSTLTGNAVAGPSSAIVEGGNLGADAKATIANSIVSGGVGPAGVGNCSKEASKRPASKGFNLDSTNQCTFAAAGDLVDADPQLGPLGLNGGPTPTTVPAITSPAVDRGTGLGLALDQRGLTRPVDFPSIPNAAGGDGADIGSVEVQPSTAIAFGKLKKNRKKGTALLTVLLPSPNFGTVTLAGKGLKARSKALGGTTTQVTFAIVTKGKAKKALRKRGKRKVGITVTYTALPTATVTLTRKATLVRKSKHKRHHKSKAHR
ncbi:MAG: choice-of-anchor Q domain-containing protein [Solirubrobacterales bacterium]